MVLIALVVKKEVLVSVEKFSLYLRFCLFFFILVKYVIMFFMKCVGGNVFLISSAYLVLLKRINWSDTLVKYVVRSVRF